MTHVFVSYLRENQETVDKLVTELRRHDVKVWLDRDEILPGQRWQQAIRNAIQKGAFFLACFSKEYPERPKYFNEELTIAIEELRRRPVGRSWLIPIKFSDCEIPDRDIGAGETLLNLQWVDLSSGWDAGVRRILAVIQPERLRLPTSLPNDEVEALPIAQQRLNSSPPTAPASADRPIESDQALARRPEHRPPAQVDVPTRAGETDTAGEPQQRLSEIADPHKQPLLKVTIPGDEVKSLQQAAASALGIPVSFRDRLKIGREGPEMIVIPSGHFRMGDTSGSGYRREQPVHAVTIKRHFAIGRYSVTFDEYDLFCEATKRSKRSDEGWGRGRQPVINVTWEDANAFCRWLSDQSGFLYRLPSEAEWEYAARGGTESAYWWGETFDSRMVRCAGRTASVRRFEPNPFGLDQVHGNVWEWVQDVWHEDYTDAPNDGSAQSQLITRREKCTVSRQREVHVPYFGKVIGGIASVPRPQPQIETDTYTYDDEVEDRSAGHVLRGGSWKDPPHRLRSSARQSGSKVNLRTVGFRVARDFD